MIDETTHAEAGKEPERVGFCQDCGRPLTRETVRTVGSGVFCEPCLQARLGAAGSPYGAVPPPPPNVGGPVYTEPFPPIGGSDPSPVLAALLGLIPGVGAMYNGQYAKGIAHIVIFALLDSMAHISGVFGLLVAGWVFYQSFEAYHTAKARRAGAPLPDPFGLNNIGEQMGIHFRGTPINTGNYPGYVPQQPIVTPPPSEGAVEPPPQPWGSAPVNPAAQVPVWDTPAWTPPPPPAAQEWQSTATYSDVPVAPVRGSRFPGAAMWLIGFGLLFLLFNLMPEWRFSIHKIFPFFLMALGVGIFVRRMSYTGGFGPGADEGDAFVSRAACSLRGPVLLFTIGVLLALQAFDVVRFTKTWPVLVIEMGVLLLLERSVGGRSGSAMPLAGTASVSDAGDGKGL